MYYMRLLIGFIVVLSCGQLSAQDDVMYPSIASVAKKYNAKLVVDIQGDEVFIDPILIDKLIKFHLKNFKYDIIVPCTKTKNYKDKSIVKFIFNKKHEVTNMTRK